MLFIKAVCVDDNITEYLNLNKVINISKYPNGNTKILIGAGLYWEVYTDSIELVKIDQVINELQNN